MRTLVPGAGIARTAAAFTLIEVLVVTSIIALLVSVLLPSLAKAREQARAALCLSNLKQVGTGLTMYVGQNRDAYPVNSSPNVAGKPRTRWADNLHRHMRDTKVYDCPSLSPQQVQDFRKPWAHTVDQATGAAHAGTKYYGGYGYNFQYLGNGRFKDTGVARPEWATPYHARAGHIRMTAQTIAIADTRGSKKGDPSRSFGQGGEAVYVVDPPLGSLELGAKGSRANLSGLANNDWYAGSGEEELVRSAPDRRHAGRAMVAFADGHAQAMDVDVLDGKTNGRPGDNRYYNGHFNGTRR